MPDYVVNNHGSYVNKAYFKYSKDNEFKYLVSKATSPCQIPIIDKALELESNSKQCNESFQQRGSYSDEFRWSYSLESNECDLGTSVTTTNKCCIEKVNNVKYNDFDQEIEWQRCMRNTRGCEMCLGTGQLTKKSCLYLLDIPVPLYKQSIPQSIPDPYYKQSVPIHKTLYPWYLKNRECKSTQKRQFYKINNLAINQNEVVNINYTKGQCGKEDQCCVMFRYAEESDKPGITQQCFDDVCKLKLSDASLRVNKTLNLNDWKAIDIYNGGRNYGGRLCSSLQTYGWSILIPVMFHTVFGLVLCYNDIKRKQASSFEGLFALFSVYPQWRVIKLWIKYATGNINLQQLNEETNVLDGSVSSIEPYVESCCQVFMY